jgi:hypothetical protein
MTQRIAPLAALAAACVAWSTQAAALPAPSNIIVVESAFYDEDMISGPGALSDSNSVGGSGSPFQVFASASETLTPQPLLTVTVSGSGNPGAYANQHAAATSTYWVQITGPADIPVPIEMKSAVTSSFSLLSDFGWGASVTVFAGGPYYSIGGGPYVPTFDFDGTRSITANTPTEVELQIFETYLYSGAESAFSGAVTLDPTFAIDPTFLRLNPGYSLEISPGVGNGTPEPASWALMLLGLTGVGGTVRRRRRRGAPGLRPA